jgi:hypothetical protein
MTISLKIHNDGPYDVEVVTTTLLDGAAREDAPLLVQPGADLTVTIWRGRDVIVREKFPPTPDQGPAYG